MGHWLFKRKGKIMNNFTAGKNKRLKTAQFANPQQGQTKAQKELAIRLADHAQIKGKNVTGYHKPGSMQGPR
jgi:hypothetical protein